MTTSADKVRSPDEVLQDIEIAHRESTVGYTHNLVLMREKYLRSIEEQISSGYGYTIQRILMSGSPEERELIMDVFPDLIAKIRGDFNPEQRLSGDSIGRVLHLVREEINVPQKNLIADKRVLEYLERTRSLPQSSPVVDIDPSGEKKPDKGSLDGDLYQVLDQSGGSLWLRLMRLYTRFLIWRFDVIKNRLRNQATRLRKLSP